MNFSLTEIAEKFGSTTLINEEDTSNRLYSCSCEKAYESGLSPGQTKSFDFSAVTDAPVMRLKI